MRTRNFRFRLSCLLLALCFVLPLFSAPALAEDEPVPLQFFVEGIAPEDLDEMAVDPQSWRLQRDATWDDFLPNPVVDWMTELDPASLVNPTTPGAGRPIPINGGLVLVDYLDRPFISGQPQGSDVLGFYMYADDGSGYDYDAGIIRNPVNSVLDFPERYPNGYQDLPKFWEDYLNDQTFTELNYGSTIDEYWRENAYGKWAVDLTAYGVYTLPYFEFEIMGTYMGQFNTYNDIPPSFRFGNPGQSAPSTSGSGNARSISLDPHATEVSRRGAADASGNPYGLPSGMPGLSRATPTPYRNFDFFFFLHSGYCTSGSWQPFGQLQASTRAGLADIFYDEPDPWGNEPWTDPLGPKGRLKIVEDFFNTYPVWIPIYAERYTSGWANHTAAWNANQYTASNPESVARVNSYRETAFWRETLANYNAHLAAGTMDEFEFKLAQEDWDWAEAYHSPRDYVGRNHVRNTRYVPFTSWEGSIGEWSHMSSRSFGTGFGQMGTAPTGVSSLNYATQGENSGMATFAHEFGHIAGWPDNYGNPWANAYSCDTEAWDIMSRGSFAGPYGDLARWSVPGAEGGSIPVHAMQGLKQRGTTRGSWFDAGDVLNITAQNLSASYPVVVNVVPRNVPLDITTATYSYDWGVPRRVGNVNTNTGFVKGIQIDFGTGTWAFSSTAKGTGFTGNFDNHRTGTVARMAIEVVEQTGYDSFAFDTGVMLSTITSTSGGTRQVVDSHSYDIDMVDFFLNDKNQPSTREGEWTRYVLAHMTQQADALFKAGKSYTDTGYYGSVRNVNEGDNIRRFSSSFVTGQHDKIGTNGTVIVPGSVKRGEDRALEVDGVLYERPIASGDTVNEWRDARNRLHYYILAKNMIDSKYGQFTSYEVAVRHFNGPAVGGELIIEEGAPVIPAQLGNYAVQTYAVTNTGDATDIVRVTLEGPIVDVAPRFQTIQVPWEGGLQPSVAEAGTSFTFNPNNRAIFVDRVVPTHFQDQNAVIFNDLYSIGPGETIYFDVLVKTATGFASDFDVTVKVSSETNVEKFAEAGFTAVVDALPTAEVRKLPGAVNELWISVVEFYSNGGAYEFTAKYETANNSTGIFEVGAYKVFIATRAHEILEISIDEFGLAAARPSAPEAPFEAVLVGVWTSAAAKDILIVGNQTWDVTFTVVETFEVDEDEFEVFEVVYTVKIAKNGSGKIDLGEYTLIYDIAGNGSNIKDFRVVLN